jgi:hypothetical protein
MDDITVVNGVRTAMLTSNKGTVKHTDSECCVEISPDPLVEGRQEIQLQVIDPSLADWCYDADEWALKSLVSHCVRLFNKPLTLMDIKARCCPITDRTYPREPCMLASLDTKRVAYSSPTGVVVAPSDWDFLEVTPAFNIKSMWFAHRGTCGLTLDMIEVSYE